MKNSPSAETPKKNAAVRNPGADVSRFSVTESHAYYIYSLQSLSYGALAEALRVHDLTPPAWRVLANLQEDDGVGVRDLAQQTTVDVSNLSKLVSAMTDRGYLRKKRSTADARVTLVYITAAGRRKFQTALPATRGVLNNNLAGFSDLESSQFLSYLRRMMANAKPTA